MDDDAVGAARETAPESFSPRAAKAGQGAFMSDVGRSWKLWAHRMNRSGEFWHVGQLPWVKLHGLSDQIVPVLVEEVLGDLHATEVTHYGWQYVEGSIYRHGDAPTMIQIRAGDHPNDPKRSLMMLDMCFPYGVKSAVDHGEGHIIALRITERQKEETS